MVRPQLSKAELEVARVLWDMGEGTVGTIHEAMSSTREIEYATLQTYVRRLEAKGYIKSTRVGRTKLYRPKVRPKKVIRETVDDMMQLLFDGEPVPMVRHLVSDRKLSSDDISELKKIIQELENDSDD
ncbi:MAG: BlaI/MecI/CopY family transcriptional regulator [Planctomycetota bacterium]